MHPEAYVSFLVRLWRGQHDNDHRDDWHGEIEHIQYGTRWCFTTHAELIAVLQQVMATPQVVTPEEDAP
jgi:hypothetical protein